MIGKKTQNKAYVMGSTARYLIIVNKYWECDPVCWVLTNKYLNDNCGLCSGNMPWPTTMHYPVYGPQAPSTPTQPRLIYNLGGVQVEVWCISDLLRNSGAAYQSSSEEKMKVLPGAFNYSTIPVGLVVAVGTASSGPFCPPYKQDNVNGSVVIGSRVFMHDAHPASNPNPYSAWRCDYFDTLMTSSVPDSAWKPLGGTKLETALLTPPDNPATNAPHIYTNGAYVAIGDVNVTDYTEYSIKDLEAGDAFLAQCQGNQNGVSLETTHGLIYATARDYGNGTPPPFLFVSGITDRYTMFNIDVNQRVYAQNQSCAHNVGVVVAQIIANIAQDII
jgi:hypothetical protein